MINHYYLQRTEFRTARHAAPAITYVEEKGVNVASELVDDLAVGDVESAASSARMLTNVVARNKRRQR